MPNELPLPLTCEGCRAMPDCPGNVIAVPSTSPRLTLQERAEVEHFREGMMPDGITLLIGEFGTGESTAKHDQITVLGSNGSGAAHIFRPGGTSRFLVVDLLNAVQVTQHGSVAEALASAAQHVLPDLTASAA
jgi:hypothetical protein